MSGEIVSCQSPNRWSHDHGDRWRCDCGVVWVVPTLRVNWRPASFRSRRWAARQHMRWLDSIGRHLGSLTPADRAWLSEHR